MNIAFNLFSEGDPLRKLKLLQQYYATWQLLVAQTLQGTFADNGSKMSMSYGTDVWVYILPQTQYTQYSFVGL